MADALERALAGEEVALVRGKEPLGTLSVRPAVLEGQLLAAPTGTREERPDREDVTVVATAMELSRTARDRLAEQFGEGFLVLDLHEAPSSADVFAGPAHQPAAARGAARAVPLGAGAGRRDRGRGARRALRGARDPDAGSRRRRLPSPATGGRGGQGGPTTAGRRLRPSRTRPRHRRITAPRPAGKRRGRGPPSDVASSSCIS
ncbi:hypothetical protein [Brachybacterium sp. GPGPB12]|uniref:hypothetical protein n=1 Tax=Brachybacterium sp. GPGPB12 TaxID=3023517 RepID=UPI0031342F01